MRQIRSVENGRYAAFDDETEKWEFGIVETITTTDGPNTGLKYIPDMDKEK